MKTVTYILLSVISLLPLVKAHGLNTTQPSDTLLNSAKANGLTTTEQPDTLLNIENPTELIILESEKGSVIAVNGVPGNPDFKASVVTDYPDDAVVKSSQRHIRKTDILSLGPGGITYYNSIPKSNQGWSLGMDGVCIGLTNSLNQPDPKAIQWAKSFEICWMSCIKLSYNFSRQLKFSIGLGFDWRNYKISTSRYRLVASGNKGIEYAEYPDGATPKNSRLKVFSLQLPLLFRCHIPNSCLELAVGPILNFNTYASVKSLYWDKDYKEIKDFTKDIIPQRTTVDFFLNLQYSLLGIYARYSPMKVMDYSSLNFNPLTVGISLML